MSDKTTRDAIVINDYGREVQKELVADAAITPGHIVEQMTTGNVRKVANAAVTQQKCFAIENYLEGKTIATAYAAADQVLVRYFSPGDEVYAVLMDGEIIAIGEKLEVGTDDGELRKQDVNSAGPITAPSAIIGYAKEALDASDSAATAIASRRFRLEIA